MSATCVCGQESGGVGLLLVIHDVDESHETIRLRPCALAEFGDS